MKMKDYQNDAVSQMVSHGINMLKKERAKKMILRSPTGSGKTAMMATFLADLAKMSEDMPLSFIWAAPRKLHIQSYEKLYSHYHESSELQCLYFHQLNDNHIGENEILFLNWESINRSDEQGNIITRPNERGIYLQKVIDNTLQSGREIVLIIDECHHQATTVISKNLIESFSPKLTVGVSATPSNVNAADKIVNVDVEDVRKEGMIKKWVVLNEGFKNESNNDGIIVPSIKGTSEEFVLKHALAKRRDLLESYKKAGSTVNPLLCVQLPNKHLDGDEGIRDTVIRVLAENNITLENGGLAIWLAGERKNEKEISRNDAVTNVLMFKQSLALGWDCPRAQILVVFRKWGSEISAVQTLGRIMRSPEPSKRPHGYGIDILDKGYVYTNVSEVHIESGYLEDDILIHSAARIQPYTPIKLRSACRGTPIEHCHPSAFGEFFMTVADKYNLANKIDKKSQLVTSKIVSEKKIENIDDIPPNEDNEDTYEVEIGDDESALQIDFEQFMAACFTQSSVNGLSAGWGRDAIYAFFAKTWKMGYDEQFSEIIKIVLNKHNKNHFAKVLNDAAALFHEKSNTAITIPLIWNEEWEVPEMDTYGKGYTERKFTKPAMFPYYEPKAGSAGTSKIEAGFAAMLDRATNVSWWYKNGQQGVLYFALPYTENAVEHLFYVDFVVRFSDGSVGLYDTKHGITLDVAKGKIKGLHSYISAEVARGRKLKGGIVSPMNPTDFSLGWQKCKGILANAKVKHSSNWELLDIK